MRQCKKVAITNQKGDVGKTITTSNLGVALAKLDKKVLIEDAAPQGDLTAYLGWYDLDNLNSSVARLMNNVIDGVLFKLMEIINKCQNALLDTIYNIMYNYIYVLVFINYYYGIWKASTGDGLRMYFHTMWWRGGVQDGFKQYN